MSNKRMVAVYLADAERAGKLSAELNQAGFEPLISQTAEDFHKILNYQRIDLVAIDNELPGFLTGIEILERLNSDLLRPPTILLGKLTSETEPRAAALGVEKLMPGDTTIEGLMSAITNALAIRTHNLVVIPPKARKLVLQSDVIQPLPQMLVKLVGYLDNQTASIPELAKDIACDPKLTAELLKITNSTAFGLRNKVTKASEAVKFLGIRKTVSLVMSASVIRMQAGLMKALPDSLRKWYYQRSVLIASTASAFARNLEGVSPETAHILGLMQDLGILVMAHGFGPRYQQLVQRIQEIGQLELEITEKQDFEITHADVSAALMLKWDLPQSLITIVANHHERESPAVSTKTEERFVHVMRIGEAVANLSSRFYPQRHQRLCRLLAVYGAAATERAKDSLAEGVAKTLESSQLFSVPVPDEEALQGLLKRLQSAGEEQAADENKSRGEILVIEDEESVLETITGIARSVGLEVLACKERARALELAPRAAAILCDVHLGQEQGTDIIKELRQSQYARPVIFVSGDRTRGTIAKCIEAGMTDFLPKPFTETDLLEKLSKHLGMALASSPAASGAPAAAPAATRSAEPPPQ
ncbi:MAG: HDOD domain-containing protein [Planctomycetia bacterium]|nr:HDOD domain-containing protein [Planctomycetia bacterium]